MKMKMKVARTDATIAVPAPLPMTNDSFKCCSISLQCSWVSNSLDVMLKLLFILLWSSWSKEFDPQLSSMDSLHTFKVRWLEKSEDFFSRQC